MDFEAMAQRWHDTDHGPDRGKPLRKNKFIHPVDEPEPQWVSPCWCCCVVCDPGWNPDGRSSPFWSRAVVSLRQG